MTIEIDDLSRPEIHALLREHLQSMYEFSLQETTKRPSADTMG